jgi:hypothetical protein
MDPDDWPIPPHSDFGDAKCCGCLFPVMRGDQADIVCNECAAVVRTVPAADLKRTFDEMELSLDLTRERCPHCGAVNLFPGFSQVAAFVCKECGRGAAVRPSRPHCAGD